MALLTQTNNVLHEKDATFPLYTWSADDLALLLDFGGPDYGVVTPEASAAIALLKETEEVTLDTTYTGKACAGMLHEIMAGKHTNHVILFWNTFCADVALPLSKPEELPVPFHQFFVP